MDIRELKQVLKPLGFKIKIRSMSWGRHATITNLAGDRELTNNVFTSDTLSFWKPALDAIRAAGSITQDTDKVYGLDFITTSMSD